MEAVDVEAVGVGHVTSGEPLVFVDGGFKEFGVVGFYWGFDCGVAGEIEVHSYA